MAKAAIHVHFLDLCEIDWDDCAIVLDEKLSKGVTGVCKEIEEVTRSTAAVETVT